MEYGERSASEFSPVELPGVIIRFQELVGSKSPLNPGRLKTRHSGVFTSSQSSNSISSVTTGCCPVLGVSPRFCSQTKVGWPEEGPGPEEAAPVHEG